MNSRKQRGSVLVVAMILLLVMSVIGMAGIEVIGLEEKMVFNMRDRQSAFEAAEATLLQAEEYVESGAVSIVNFADKGGAGGLYEAGGDDTCNDASSGQVWEKDWSEGCYRVLESNDDAFAQLADSDTDDTSYTARYIIEELSDINIFDSLGVGSGDMKESFVYYRITAMAKGLTSSAEVRLQTVYKVKRKS